MFVPRLVNVTSLVCSLDSNGYGGKGDSAKGTGHLCCVTERLVAREDTTKAHYKCSIQFQASFSIVAVCLLRLLFLHLFKQCLLKIINLKQTSGFGFFFFKMT